MELATEKQVKFMQGLSIDIPEGCSKAMAKDMIALKLDGPEKHETPAPTPTIHEAAKQETSVTDDRQTSIIAQCMVKCASKMLDEGDTNLELSSYISACVEGYKQAVKELQS